MYGQRRKLAVLNRSHNVLNMFSQFELEFGNREDGRNFCRVWGSINNTEIQSYLFALDCLPIE